MIAVRAAKRSGVRGLVALAVTALALVGCGPYEAEPATPYAYRVPPPEPATAVELQARADARAAEAQAEGSASVGTGPEIAVGANADEYADTDPSALTEFKPALAPYGAWVDDPTYGTVWAPREEVVGADFEPYVTAGHWTYSDDTSWVWVSDYDWGWAPFHYGRWVRLPARGWVWIPGRVYSGAWVSWRTGPVGYEYVGWAPMAPEWYWWNGVAVGWGFGWYQPHYVYCSHSYLYGPVVSTYVIRSGPAYVGIQERTQPYAPPNGGRVLAQPGVAGGGRVVAQPGVGGGRTIASPRVSGPRPEEIGMSANRITPPPSNHAGLMKAEAFATPKTAMAQGASAPIQTRPRSTDALVSNAPAQSGVMGGGGAYRGYATGVSPSSRSLEPAARAPQIAGVAPAPVRPSSGGPLPEYRSRSVGTDAYAAPSSPAYRPSSPSVSSAPSYRPSAPSVSSTPSYRPSAPSAPTFHSSPSISSTPSYRPSAPSVSAPSYRPSAPSVSHSSPSVSAPRSSGTRSTSGGATRSRR